MKTNIMKKMIVIKNLKSNLIEEAYIVFKDNVKIHKLNLLNDNDNSNLKYKLDSNNELINNDDNYIVKEAEKIINDYAFEMEKRYPLFNINIMNSKYMMLRICTISFIAFSLLEFLLVILK